MPRLWPNICMIGMAALFLGCSGDERGTLEGDVFTNPFTVIEMQSGDHFYVGLESGGFAGITWEVEDQGDPLLLRFLGPTSDETECCDTFGQTRFEFEALEEGATTLVFRSSEGESRSFDVNTSAIN